MLEAVLTTLRSRDPLPLLTPEKVWDASLSRQIQTASDTELWGAVDDSPTAQLCRAGLLLWNDDLDAAHEIAQRYEGDQTADYWHAIMHRREGDEGNARYWWRRVGAHPAFEDMGRATVAMLRDQSESGAQSFAAQLERVGTWLPVEFTALCARASGDDTWLRRVQVMEIDTFLGWCANRLIKTNP